jgi:hypothetical protein
VSDHPWMEHAETGHRAQLPDMPYWRAQGWAPCDGPPPEPDRLHDPAEPVLQDPEPVADEPAKRAGKPSAKSEEK